MRNYRARLNGRGENIRLVYEKRVGTSYIEMDNKDVPLILRHAVNNVMTLFKRRRIKKPNAKLEIKLTE